MLPGGGLRRQNPQGRKTGRSAGGATDKIRIPAQPQDRQGAGPRGALTPATDRRRGRRMMAPSFEMAWVALRLTDKDDHINSMVAERIIELATAGERNPDILCE